MKEIVSSFKIGFLASLLVVLLSAHSAFSQKSMDSVFVLPDSVVTFSIDEFYRIILEYHPVVNQASLLSQMAQQEVRLARGGFDPRLNLSIDRKDFQDKTYYDKLNGYVSFPTWFPVNPKVGVEQNSGEFLNESESIPGERQFYAGVSVPIGRGLFTDERRAAVQQAQLFQTIAEAEQIKMINKVLLNAAKDYWNWYYAYYDYRLLNQATTIAQELFRRVKLDESFGEAAVIDTVQAKITLQSRLIERQEAFLNFQNAGITLSNYLWDDQGQPLQLSLNVAPILEAGDQSLLDLQTATSLAELARENHPELIKLRTKFNQLEVQRRLASEYLKPQLDLNYSVLTLPDPVQVNFEDFKFGLDFSIPVFLRKERSKLALTKLKIQDNQFAQSQTEREIVNEINLVFNQITNTSTIVNQLRDMVDLYDRILSAELLNLENGESDLFKINIQQEKLIQSQSKLLKLLSEYQKMKANLYWAAGVRNLNFETP
ncbi:MAG: TolC family protein [Cyclobacteriaceae bacterium]